MPFQAFAGLYYSGERFADLPSQWRGFLLDQRALRMVAVKPAEGATPHPLRVRYQQDLARLEQQAKTRKLTADELADLGALYLRLGETGRGLEVLRAAHQERPEHFRIAANLGTAWQMQGDLGHAAAALQHALRLAPGKYQKAEELHLKLVRLRQREGRDLHGLDNLFGVRFIGPDSKYVPGQIAAEQRKHLPSDAAAIVQQLGLWLPADGRLLWLLAELAGAHGDVRTSAAIMDGCVTEFGLRHSDLLAHRREARAAADRLGDKAGPDKAAHEGHAGLLKTRSSRPLPTKLDAAALPPIDPTGVNALPWSVVLETTLDRNYKPTFPRYLKELAGKKVQLQGYMQPLGDGPELTSFLLIENPVGCWYCEMPELPGMVMVELPPGKAHNTTRSPLRITGRLALNPVNPESFLYTLEEATVAEME